MRIRARFKNAVLCQGTTSVVPKKAVKQWASQAAEKSLFPRLKIHSQGQPKKYPRHIDAKSPPASPITASLVKDLQPLLQIPVTWIFTVEAGFLALKAGKQAPGTPAILHNHPGVVSYQYAHAQPTRKLL
jgi:hypothetical protein